MKPDTLRRIISGFRKFRLTKAEMEFVGFAEFCLNQNNPLSEMMGLMLVRMYTQKTEFIRCSILSLLKENAPVIPQTQIPDRRNEAMRDRT